MFIDIWLEKQCKKTPQMFLSLKKASAPYIFQFTIASMKFLHILF